MSFLLESAPHETNHLDGWLSLVEGTGFENRRWGNLSGGSNPSPSAEKRQTSKVLVCLFLCAAGINGRGQGLIFANRGSPAATRSQRVVIVCSLAEASGCDFYYAWPTAHSRAPLPILVPFAHSRDACSLSCFQLVLMLES